MFSILITVADFTISFVYPLYWTYALLSSTHSTGAAHQVVESISGTVTLPRTTISQWEDCIAYWLILAAVYFVGTLHVARVLINIIPFSGFLILYLKAWLVLPVVPYGNTKVTGAHMLYSEYIYDYLGEMSAYIDSKGLPMLKGAKGVSAAATAAANLAQPAAQQRTLGTVFSDMFNGTVPTPQTAQQQAILNSLLAPLTAITGLFSNGSTEGFELVNEPTGPDYGDIDTRGSSTTSSRQSSGQGSRPGSRTGSRKSSGRNWWKGKAE